jgi:hypothetical protein
MTSDPRSVIDAIRKEYLREDAPFLRAQLEAIAPRVSEQQYESWWDFVRELVQNADDCDYDDRVDPEFRLTRSDAEFRMQSNEIGFREKDVWAICQFGKSSKIGDRNRFIGEKGLGFKACFRVSDRPEIHSNGFHFRFDVSQGLGRVAPQWVDEAVLSPGTTIILPLRDEVRQESGIPDHLKPTRWSLLFLRKLNRIEYLDRRSGHCLRIRRSVEGDRLRLEHEETKGSSSTRGSQWFRIFREEVDVSRLKEPEREGVQATTVTVAIPFDEDRGPSLRLNGFAYAYLPIEPTGLAFPFNADLKLKTDRAAAIAESSWNRALFQGLGRCLAQAILAHCGGEPEGVRAVGLLRKPIDLKPTYRPILETAVAVLKQKRCIPSRVDRWVRPEQALLPDADDLHALVDPETLERRTGRWLASPEVEKVRREAEEGLEIRTFSLVHLDACLADDVWIASRTDEWFGHLYTTLGRILERGELRADDLDRLRRRRILRLGDGRTVARDTIGKVFRGLGSGHRYGFEHDIPMLADAAYESLTDDKRDATRFLDALGVPSMTPSAVIDDHILPKHRDGGSARLVDAELVAHACYVLDHLDVYQKSSRDSRGNGIGAIMAHLGILTRSNLPAKRVRRKASNMYLGRPYRDPHDLESLWAATMPDRFISPLYREAATPKGAKREWAKFFMSLRARCTPAIDVSKGGEPAYCGWAVESLELLRDTDEQNRWRFLGIIASEWEEYAEAIRRRGIDPLDSKLVTDLRGIEVTAKGGRRPLRDCFLDTPDNQAAFGSDRPYLDKNRFRSLEFAEICGVTTGPSIPKVLERLREISRDAVVDAATVESVERLYRYLSDRHASWDRSVMEAFEKLPLILAGRDEDGWARRGEACWAIGASLGRHGPRRELSPRWSSLRSFFVNQLKVPESLCAEDWIKVLVSVRTGGDPPARMAELVRLAYRGLSKVARGFGNIASEFRKHPLVLCRDGVWRSCGGGRPRIVDDDDPPIARLLADRPSIAFIDIDPSDRVDVDGLFSVLEIPSLRSLMSIEPATGEDLPAPPEIGHRLANRVLDVARLLYHESNDLYKTALREGLFEFLARPTVEVTLSFRVTVGTETVESRLDAKLVGQGAKRRLHVGQPDVSDDLWRAIGIALGLEFELSRHAAMSLGALLVIQDEEGVQRMLEQYEIPGLPPEAMQDLPRGTVHHPSRDVEKGRKDVRGLPQMIGEESDAVRGRGPESTESLTKRRIDTVLPDRTFDPGPSGRYFGSSRGDEISPPHRTVESRPGRWADREPREPTDVPPSLPGYDRSLNFSVPRGRTVSQSRLGTYASPVPPTISDELIREIEGAAVRYVLDYERQRGRDPRDVNIENPCNPGYDILSIDPMTGVRRYIEVKGTRDAWDIRGVDVTATQIQHGLEHGENAWLYVVEYALEPGRIRCWCIQNFAARVERVAFDGGWKELAEPEPDP